MTYSCEYGQFIEAIFNEADTLNICFYGEDSEQQDNYVSTIGKCFPYVMVFPYVCSSMAKKSIVIRDI